MNEEMLLVNNSGMQFVVLFPNPPNLEIKKLTSKL